MAKMNHKEMKGAFISNLMDRGEFTLNIQDKRDICKRDYAYTQGIVDGRRIRNSSDAYEALESIFEDTFLNVDLRRPKLINSDNNIKLLKEIFKDGSEKEVLEILNILASSDEVDGFLQHALYNHYWLFEFTDKSKLSKQGSCFTYSTENAGEIITRMKAIGIIREAFKCSFKDMRLDSKVFKETPDLCLLLHKVTKTYNDISEYLNLLKSHEKTDINLVGFSKEDTISKILAILKAEDFSLKLVSQESMEKWGLQRLKAIDKITAWPMEVAEFNAYMEDIIRNSLSIDIDEKTDYCTTEELIITLTNIGNKNMAVKTAVNLAIRGIGKEPIENQGVQMNLF